MSETVVVFTTQNIHEANIVRSILESNGIDIFSIDENMTRMHPLISGIVGGIKIEVPASQINRAQELLEEYRESAGQDPNYGKGSPFNVDITQLTEDKKDTIFDLRAGKFFREDERGRLLFRPWGKYGNAYMIDSDNDYERIRRGMRWFNGAFIFMLLFIAGFTLSAVALPFYFMIRHTKVKQWTANMVKVTKSKRIGST